MNEESSLLGHNTFESDYILGGKLESLSNLNVLEEEITRINENRMQIAKLNNDTIRSNSSHLHTQTDSDDFEFAIDASDNIVDKENERNVKFTVSLFIKKVSLIRKPQQEEAKPQLSIDSDFERAVSIRINGTKWHETKHTQIGLNNNEIPIKEKPKLLKVFKFNENGKNGNENHKQVTIDFELLDKDIIENKSNQIVSSHSMHLGKCLEEYRNKGVVSLALPFYHIGSQQKSQIDGEIFINLEIKDNANNNNNVNATSTRYLVMTLLPLIWKETGRIAATVKFNDVIWFETSATIKANVSPQPREIISNSNSSSPVISIEFKEEETSNLKRTAFNLDSILKSTESKLIKTRRFRLAADSSSQSVVAVATEIISIRLGLFQNLKDALQFQSSQHQIAASIIKSNNLNNQDLTKQIPRQIQMQMKSVVLPSNANVAKNLFCLFFNTKENNKVSFATTPVQMKQGDEKEYVWPEDSSKVGLISCEKNDEEVLKIQVMEYENSKRRAPHTNKVIASALLGGRELIESAEKDEVLIKLFDGIEGLRAKMKWNFISPTNDSHGDISKSQSEVQEEESLLENIPIEDSIQLEVVTDPDSNLNVNVNGPIIQKLDYSLQLESISTKKEESEMMDRNNFEFQQQIDASKLPKRMEDLDHIYFKLKRKSNSSENGNEEDNAIDTLFDSIKQLAENSSKSNDKLNVIERRKKNKIAEKMRMRLIERAKEENSQIEYSTNTWWNDDCKSGVLGGFYQGTWLNNKRNGFGENQWEDGSYYIGEWKNGKFNGVGFYHYPDESNLSNTVVLQTDINHANDSKLKSNSEMEYIGEWKEGKIHGWGEMKWNDGKKYEGQWENGTMEGFGNFTYTNNQKPNSNSNSNSNTVINNCVIYRGYFRKGQKDGLGVLLIEGDQLLNQNLDQTTNNSSRNSNNGGDNVDVRADQSINSNLNSHRSNQNNNKTSLLTYYGGYFKDGKQHGHGYSYKEDKQSKTILISSLGEWNEGKMNGYGCMKWNRENVCYFGEFRNGMISGNGVFRYDNKWKGIHYLLRGKYINGVPDPSSPLKREEIEISLSPTISKEEKVKIRL